MKVEIHFSTTEFVDSSNLQIFTNEKYLVLFLGFHNSQGRPHFVATELALGHRTEPLSLLLCSALHSTITNDAAENGDTAGRVYDEFRFFYAIN